MCTYLVKHIGTSRGKCSEGYAFISVHLGLAQAILGQVDPVPVLHVANGSQVCSLVIDWALTWSVFPFVSFICCATLHGLSSDILDFKAKN